MQTWSQVETYLQIRKRQEGLKTSDNHRLRSMDIKVLYILGSENETKARLCAEVIAGPESGGMLVVELGETTQAVLETLSPIPGFVPGFVPSFISVVHALIKEDSAQRVMYTDQLAGFMLGVLRASVNTPHFFQDELTPLCLQELLVATCYPWKPGSSTSDGFDNKWLSGPSMDAGGTAGALNNATREFIATSGATDGDRGTRMAIAAYMLNTIRSPFYRKAPLSWVGGKVMEAMTDGVLRQIRFPERADIAVEALEKIIPKPKQ